MSEQKKDYFTAFETAMLTISYLINTYDEQNIDADTTLTEVDLFVERTLSELSDNKNSLLWKLRNGDLDVESLE